MAIDSSEAAYGATREAMLTTVTTLPSRTMFVSIIENVLFCLWD